MVHISCMFINKCKRAWKRDDTMSFRIAGSAFQEQMTQGKKKENMVSEVKLRREMASVRLSFQTCCFCLIKIVNVQSFKDGGNVKGSSLYFIIQDIWTIHKNYFVETLRSSS